MLPRAPWLATRAGCRKLPRAACGRMFIRAACGRTFIRAGAWTAIRAGAARKPPPRKPPPWPRAAASVVLSAVSPIAAMAARAKRDLRVDMVSLLEVRGVEGSHDAMMGTRAAPCVQWESPQVVAFAGMRR